jgi:threonine/homoserine/homoserine lactone efflux protein
LAPGPDNLYVLTQSAIGGRLAGLAVTLGLCTGLIVHTTAVALGIAALFQASTLAFIILKLIGAGDLLVLAWQAFHASSQTIATSGRENPNLWRLYRRGMIMNLTNPKVSMFFLAFLPSFADPARGSLTLQLFGFGGLFILATVGVFGTLALVAGSLGSWLGQSVKAQRFLNRITGIVLPGLAVKLVMIER